MRKKQVLGNYRLPKPLGDNHQRLSATVGSRYEPTNRKSRRKTTPVTPIDKQSVNGVDLIGPLPAKTADGYVATYDVSEYKIFYYPHKTDINSNRRTARSQKSRSPRKGSYTVFYVNGMQGNPEKFRAQACATAAVSGGPVIGVFNEGVNIAADLVQCLTDKVFSNDWLNLKVEAWKLFGSPTQAEIDKYVYENLNESNKCAASLYQQLMNTKGESRIVAHSQGNIIMCNAVNGVYAARGAEGIKNIRLYSVASPVVFWSNAKPCVEKGAELNFSNDFVSWLGMNVGDESYLIGWNASELGEGETEITGEYDTSWNPGNLLTHQFYIYLEKYWELLQGYFE